MLIRKNANKHSNNQSSKKYKYGKFIYISLLVPLLFLITIYPFFGINSYYNKIEKYIGLYGLNWLRDRYPDDYTAITWLDDKAPLLCSNNNLNIPLQKSKNPISQSPPGERNAKCPVILEAVGDSYTVYARVSANTGLPTVIGWPVHEWLWRGSYDEAGKRRSEVESIYNTDSLEQAQSLLEKYEVKYIFVGSLEREAYPNINEEKFKQMGEIIYQSGETRIYRL